MSPTPGATRRADVARLLLFGAGLAYALAAIGFNEILAGWLDRSPPLAEATVAGIRSSQAIFALLAATLLGSATLLPRVPRIAAVLRRPPVSRGLLALLTVALPISLAELALRPFAKLGSQARTSIFERDPDLGWRLRPGSRDVWGGVEVAINGKGLRGPELPYEKPPGRFRILYLGDSVTFGFMLAHDEETFPQQVEALLSARGLSGIETINAGVGGYSPWQQLAFLETEGIRYDPDLIVVGFVLNDVTEKFGLLRFGGAGEGFQLSVSATSLRDRLAARSALVHFARRGAARLRFGAELQEGARRKEALDVRALAVEPDRADVQEAWRLTLENLGRIFDFGSERAIPVALVVLPFKFQLADPEALSTPQRVVGEFAARHDVPVLDLLPAMGQRLEREGRTPDDYLLDEDHLSPLGSRATAEIVQEFLLEQGLVGAAGRPPR